VIKLSASGLAGRGVWAVSAALVAAVLLVAISELAYRRSTQSLHSLGERAVARAQLNTLLRGLSDAETGQRGYLLTGRAEYLRPYERAVEEVGSVIGTLRARYGDDPEAGPIVRRIAALSEEKLSELATTLKLFGEGRLEASRELILTDIGREKMDAARHEGERLLDIESRLVAQERQLVFDTLQMGRVGVGAMAALSLLAIVLFVRQTARLMHERAERARATREERDQLEGEVVRRTAELTELAQHLQTAREDERARLARELHDELGALLTAAKLDTARMRRTVGTSTELRSRLDHLVATIDEGIALKRRIIEDLHPSSLANLGLAAALQILAREFAARAEIELQAEVAELLLPEDGQITAYRLVQEAFTNIAKYARARTVQLTMVADGSMARLAVVDDGCGFDPVRTRGSTHGLLGMRYRVEAVGGVLSVSSTPGQGTRIEARLPLSSA